MTMHSSLRIRPAARTTKSTSGQLRRSARKRELKTERYNELLTEACRTGISIADIMQKRRAAAAPFMGSRTVFSTKSPIQQPQIMKRREEPADFVLQPRRVAGARR